MKKFANIVKSLCLVLLAGVLLAGCGDPTPTVVDGGDIVHAPTITSWYDGGNGTRLLDTSVNIDFDQVKIADVDKITFILKDGDEVLGTAVSKGENLETLLEDCASYWATVENPEEYYDSYLDVKGDRIISCAFATRTEENDNGYWVRSACTATDGVVPDGLEVRVVVGDTEYVTEK